MHDPADAVAAVARDQSAARLLDHRRRGLDDLRPHHTRAGATHGRGNSCPSKLGERLGTMALPHRNGHRGIRAPAGHIADRDINRDRIAIAHDSIAGHGVHHLLVHADAGGARELDAAG